MWPRHCFVNLITRKRFSLLVKGHPQKMSSASANRREPGAPSASSPRPNNGSSTQNKICQFKLVLLGESAVGKSSLVLRFVKGQFHEYQESTIGGKLVFE